MGHLGSSEIRIKAGRSRGSTQGSGRPAQVHRSIFLGSEVSFRTCIHSCIVQTRKSMTSKNGLSQEDLLQQCICYRIGQSRIAS
jgi:hypothetical protein